MVQGGRVRSCLASREVESVSSLHLRESATAYLEADIAVIPKTLPVRKRCKAALKPPRRVPLALMPASADGIEDPA